METSQDVFQYIPANKSLLKRPLQNKHETRKQSIENKEIPQSPKNMHKLHSIQKIHPKNKIFPSKFINFSENQAHHHDIPLKKNCDIDFNSPLQEDIFQVQFKNSLLYKELQQMEQELANINNFLEIEHVEDSNIEKELMIKYEKDKQKYNDCIKTLENRLEYLIRVSNIFEECFSVKIRHENGKFLCSTLKDCQEITIAFSINGYYTTYYPIKVNFPPGNFLNYQIEDMNRPELSSLFTRLLKLIYNT